jgi:hypothetical protein
MLKTFPKIIIIFFLTVFVLQLICLFFLLAVPAASQAADPATFKPQVEIPGLEKEFTKDKTGGYILPQDTGGIAKYIRAIYKYAIGIVGILAAVVLMIGGVMWIIAGGNATAIGEAKSWIGASLTGLVLALLSYLILATVNPALVDLKVTKIQTVQAPPMGCCITKGESGKSSCQIIKQSECKADDWKGTDYICSNEQCVINKALPGCCIINYDKKGLVWGYNPDSVCYKNVSQEKCKDGGGLYNFPADSKNIQYKFDVPDASCYVNAFSPYNATPCQLQN